jgi:lysophospholipid acyltransferase 1/2
LEYFSYNFSFLSILAGPSVTYKEYDDFITGKNITCCQQELTNEPNPLLPMGKKFISAVVFMLLFALNGNRLDKSLVLDPDLQVHTRFINIVIFCFIIRCQYYFTFLIVESVCNAGGLGFNGLDDKGNEKWDLAQGIDIINFEFGLNVREQSIAWNKTTAAWIRRVVYDRSNSVLASYCVSALWHGFYPGYYVCFFFIAAVTLAGRKLRRLLWHHFQQPYILKIIYDIMSIASTDFCKDLAEMSFVLLLVNDIYIIWRYYYFFPLIVLPVILLIPVKKKNTLKDKQK